MLHKASQSPACHDTTAVSWITVSHTKWTLFWENSRWLSPRCHPKILHYLTHEADTVDGLFKSSPQLSKIAEPPILFIYSPLLPPAPAPKAMCSRKKGLFLEDPGKWILINQQFYFPCQWLVWKGACHPVLANETWGPICWWASEKGSPPVQRDNTRRKWPSFYAWYFNSYSPTLVARLTA